MAESRGGKGNIPKYAVRLIVLCVLGAIVFFGGLQLFIPEGSALTGSYDAASLKYIAAAPVSYAGSESCAGANCHEPIYKKWSAGAHGAGENKSRCEVCHGPQGGHPDNPDKLVKVRGGGDLADLCLSCHQKLKARANTGQPQIVPSQHPYPHEGKLNYAQCHDPHAPGLFKKPASVESNQTTASAQTDAEKNNQPSSGESLASQCFACHGQSGRGGFAPVLVGQSYQVLKDKLIRIKSGEINSPMMKPIASGISDSDIELLARYFEGAK